MEVIRSGKKPKHNILVYCSSENNILMVCHQPLIEAASLTRAGSAAQIYNLSFSCLASDILWRQDRSLIRWDTKGRGTTFSINILIMLTFPSSSGRKFRGAARARCEQENKRHCLPNAEETKAGEDAFHTAQVGCIRSPNSPNPSYTQLKQCVQTASEGKHAFQQSKCRKTTTQCSFKELPLNLFFLKKDFCQEKNIRFTMRQAEKVAQGHKLMPGPLSFIPWL